MSGGLTEFEIAQIERMVMADRDAAHLVLVDVIVAALNGAAGAGVDLGTMIAVLDKTSETLVGKAMARGVDPLAAITAPRKAV